MANQCPIANSTGLLDFAVGLVKYVFSLPDGQVNFSGSSNYRRTVFKPDDPKSFFGSS